MGTKPITPPLRIGLTGGIGSGKTTVSELFEELTVPVIDADKIAHDLVTTGQPAYIAILEKFGHDVMDEHGDLRRDYLRNIIFNNKVLKAQLEAIIHPLVRKEIQKQISKIDCPYCIVSIPLLLETSAETTVDRILVVDVPEATQIARASARDNVDKRNIRQIIQAQVSRDERLKAADDIIDNDTDLKNLKEQVKMLHEKFLKIAHNAL